uniref:DUF1868 domain-containing protein n=2 Tax=Gloeothece TaxID=28070 RepID=E0UHN8_GLOV7|nr:conserved hypothetical protein [Gloeothece verrucosa PCC 7822]
MTLLATYESQLQNIQKSPKFIEGEPAIFEGYSIITPPGLEDPDNTDFYQNLEAFQKQLVNQVEPGLIVPTPIESYHFTVADLIWDGAYKDAAQNNPNFDQQLKACIQESFEKYQESAVTGGSLQWQILGLLIYPRSLVVGLAPKDESVYEQIAELRRSIYQNSGLMGLGIEQQYYFTAHITLGYFGEIPENLDRDNLANLLSKFNDQWLENDPQILSIKQVQLRKFTNMTRFERESDYPILEL